MEEEIMKNYTVKYKTNKIKDRGCKWFDDFSQAHEFAILKGMDGYDVIIYDNTKKNREVIAEDWGVR